MISGTVPHVDHYLMLAQLPYGEGHELDNQTIQVITLTNVPLKTLARVVAYKYIYLNINTMMMMEQV